MDLPDYWSGGHAVHNPLKSKELRRTALETVTVQLGYRQGSVVSVYLGNGDGTFQARSNYSPGTNSQPFQAATADFNGDGQQDVVTANFNTRNVSVLIGNGDGTFQPFTSYSTGSTGRPHSVVTGDYDGDGNQDFIANVPDTANSRVNVFLGNGDGTFWANTIYGTDNGDVHLASDDLNNDGALDLVTANRSGTVSVLLGNTRQIMSLGISPPDLTTRQSARDSLPALDEALTRISSLAGTIGAAMSRFEVAAANLRVASENFTAAESLITDADLAEESAGLVKGQILQQAGAAILGQANQAPALALQLIGSIG